MGYKPKPKMNAIHGDARVSLAPELTERAMKAQSEHMVDYAGPVNTARSRTDAEVHAADLEDLVESAGLVVARLREKIEHFMMPAPPPTLEAAPPPNGPPSSDYFREQKDKVDTLRMNLRDIERFIDRLQL